ncbi:unnamed protein product [Ilex paraguariensis]|uniref:AT hook motif-containing protein n=1 Tax=Ilex paraguariensis TaxID=185542 RepID=A0ABC8T9Y0_9AQUA
MNQGDNPDTPPAVPLKRKRGRPRKDQSLKRVKVTPVPPGLEGVNGNQPHQIGPVDDAKDGMVGQAVTGVVEAEFDAGYLLSVRVGNSNTSLRGLVFKPGHYVPVTAENDVVPHVQMIRRNEVHLPAKNRTRVRGYNQQFRERPEQNHLSPTNQVHRLAPQTASLVVSKVKYASPVAAPSVPPVGARGTVVPVVLQPVDVSNGLPLANQVPLDASRAALLTASRGKQVQTITPLAVLPPGASIPVNQALTVASEALPSQLQTSHQVTLEAAQNENGLFCQGTPELPKGEESRSFKSADMLMPGEVNKDASQSPETHTENRNVQCKFSAENVRVIPKQEIGDMNEPLLVEPLQAVQSHHNQFTTVSKPLADRRPGRMTELLQENMMGTQGCRVEQQATETEDSRN